MALLNKMARKYDVIIVGGGPAGIFAALELAQASDIDILLIEKGRDIDGRQCPARDRGSLCISCSGMRVRPPILTTRTFPLRIHRQMVASPLPSSLVASSGP